MKKIVALILFFNILQADAQNEKTIEQNLLTTFKKIDYWLEHYESSDKVHSSDSIAAVNEIFLAKLLKYTAANPSTITYPFKALQKEGVNIATSDDGLFRIYSWNTFMGGTAHDFDVVYQYKSNNKVFSKAPDYIYEEGDFGASYSAIHTVKAVNKTYYLGVSLATFSSKDCYQAINAFTIENNSLNDSVQIIKTKTGLKNELGFEFNFFLLEGHNERPLQLVYYDKVKKILKIPVVIEAGKVTSKFIMYKFTGKYFEKI
ncbi:hypothetical protein [Ferruginibacter sp. SUN106]|uniref:hypothetical protein n=1 Tax=Ferruginibacter sp. SUN106 TaxID=2978348 RepID=UPI003D365D66